jgi:SAM-dependent methyltransferase
MNPDPAQVAHDIIISTRTFQEYQAMFSLTDHDLKGRILDCPAGGASFTATARARGFAVTAVDIAFARGGAELAQQIKSDIDRSRLWGTSSGNSYDWAFYGDPAAFFATRQSSCTAFAEDIEKSPGSYVAGALPHLPFTTDSFDVVLSSHLLFNYAYRLSAEFHVDALSEMARVSRGDVRVYPVVDHNGHPLADLMLDITIRLEDSGITCRRERVEFEFLKGANEMLVLRSR